MAAAVDGRSVLDLRESEIENLHAVLGEQNVAGLQVAVDNAPSVRGVERVQDLIGLCERLSKRHRSAQALALDVLHDKVVGADVVERTDMRMVHRRDGPSLTFKTLTETAVTRLDGDQPIEARVSRLPNLTHAASAKGGQNLIRAEAGASGESHGRWPRL